MDNITHALAGSLIAAAAVARVGRSGVSLSSRARTALFTVGVVTAELPDADLLYAGQALGMGKLGYLLHHRGHTHTMLFAIAAALVVWWLVRRLVRELRSGPAHSALLTVALAGTLSHLVLDFSNSYGIHPFWPADNRWFYGDAVFIVEPWLFVMAIPALVLLAERRLMRGILLALLLAMLGAAWFIGMVDRTVAVVLTAAAPLWWFALSRAPASRRAAYALAAWVAVEVTFFTGSSLARSSVARAIGSDELRDAALTPAIGNPFCYNALVVHVDGTTYRATRAIVASAPSVVSVTRCIGGTERTAGAMEGATHPAIRWGGTYSAPLAELRMLVNSNCEIAAAAQFVRVPTWLMRGDSIAFDDMRYSENGRGFAGIVAPARPEACPKHVPGWIPPRQDLYGG